MKKNIWENVYYRLKDPVEIKLAILYVLYYADIPVSDVELKHCMLEGTSVDFLELCDVIERLLEENHMKTVSLNVIRRGKEKTNRRLPRGLGR